MNTLIPSVSGHPWRKNAPVWITGCLLPLLALFIFGGTDWFYEPPGWLDPFMYTGYGYNYPSHEYLPGYYKISRLPWVLTQAAAHRLLPHELVLPVFARLMLVALSLLSFILFRKLTKNITMAALAANAVALSPIVNNLGISGGYTYHVVLGLILLIARNVFSSAQTV
jgi:hypothetical protein